MKTLALMMLVVGLGWLSGCTDTPAYSGAERAGAISRNMQLDGQEIADDVDMALLLRPSDPLTYWDVYHRN